MGTGVWHDVPTLVPCARFPEEPGAGNPHAGICEGGGYRATGDPSSICKKMNAIEGEARTRIIWGEHPAAVIEFLSQNGYPVARAEGVVAFLLGQRYRLIRRRGVRRLLVGTAVVPVCALLVVAVFPKDAEAVFSGDLDGMGLAGLVVGFFWGVWKLMDGLRDLLRPEGVSDCLGFHNDKIW